MNNRSQVPIQKSPAAAGTMGTFAGVFTPSFLTIIGIIFFMRLGYVVGHAGLWNAILIIAIANVIVIVSNRDSHRHRVCHRHCHYPGRLPNLFQNQAK